LVPMAIVVFAICAMSTSLMTFMVLFSMVLVKANFLHTHINSSMHKFLFFLLLKKINLVPIYVMYTYYLTIGYDVYVLDTCECHQALIVWSKFGQELEHVIGFITRSIDILHLWREFSIVWRWNGKLPWLKYT
jgi:hypothetical protein